MILGQIPAFSSNNLDITSCLTRPKFFKKEVSCKNYYRDSFKNNNFLENIKDLNLYDQSHIENDKKIDYLKTKIIFFLRITHVFLLKHCVTKNQNMNLLKNLIF